jgi:molybdopterin adenylyltransferase
MKIGRLSLLDPALPVARQDLLGPEVEKVIASLFMEPSQFATALVPNDREKIRAALVRLCDEEKCPLVLTTGGTGPVSSDVTPDVTREIADRELPGFGEIMRYYSYERFKVAVLSRATAGVRGESLIINLPARPKPVKFCLKLLQEGIAEALGQITGKSPTLRGDEIVIPAEKYLPFLKYLRVRSGPNPEHPSL